MAGCFPSEYAKISKRQVVRLLTARLDGLILEGREVLCAGLATARWVTVDDTAARHARQDGVTTQMPANDQQRRVVELTRTLVWWLYADLKAWQRDPCLRRAAALRVRFDRIFTRRTGYVVLDRLLARLHRIHTAKAADAEVRWCAGFAATDRG